MECKEMNQITTLPILLGVGPDEAGGGLVVEVVDKEGGSHSTLSKRKTRRGFRSRSKSLASHYGRNLR
jgi:hypothetical protein